ncbi:MAG: hypothetical protein AAB548_00185 [Patescibacteria group bacterium]
MKLKLFLSLLLFIPFFLVSASKVSADCQIANWDPNTRNLQVCVGQFDSPTQLRSSTANFHCLDNSNPGPGFCTGIENNNYSLSGTPDSQIAQDPSGKYYTCITGQGLSRGIGKIEVVFSGGQNCTTSSIDTIPSDWNPLTEGTIFSGEPGRTSGGGETECVTNGTKGINTALGCISYDAEGGGFVKSLLGILIGLGGGVALLLILYGVFIVTTSAGIPDKLNQGKEIISSAVAGLVFIILAIFLMQLIGVQILALPGL